jgi:hypothetical protein
MSATHRRLAAIFLLSCALACKKHPTQGGAASERGPIIDSHTLVAPIDDSIDTALAIFKRVGVVKFCNKNGGFFGSRGFTATLRIKHRLKEQFEFFVNPSWNRVVEPGWGENEADRFEREVHWGAKGIKFFKAMGLGARDINDKLIPIDDPRFDPIMARAAKLNAVVAIHVADPKAFFEPPTPQNERWDELKLAPDWSFYGGDFPPFMELWKQTERLITRHPNTTFLLIHLGMSEDLDYMEKLLDAHPNVYVDTSARVPEFGRHPPDKVRRFFTKFQDRILFGTDQPGPLAARLGVGDAGRPRGRGQVLSGALPLLRDRRQEHRPPHADSGALEGERHSSTTGCPAQAVLRQRRQADLHPRDDDTGDRSHGRRATGARSGGTCAAGARQATVSYGMSPRPPALITSVNPAIFMARAAEALRAPDAQYRTTGLSLGISPRCAFRFETGMLRAPG